MLPRLVHVSVAHGLANRRARDDAPIHQHGFDNLYRETVQASQFFQKSYVSRLFMSEAKIRAH